MMKFLKGWKTVGFGLSLIVLPLLELALQMDLSVFVPPEYLPFVFVGIGVTIVLLRLVTNTGVGKGE